MPRLVPGRAFQGQSRFSPGRSETASVNARPSSRLLLGSGRAPPAGDADPGVASPSAVRRAAKRPEGGERHTKNAVSSGGGERGGSAGTATPGRARSCRRRTGAGSEAAETMRPGSERRRPRCPGPSWTVPPLAQPPPGRPGPRLGKGRPLAPAAGEGSRSAPAEPGNLRAGKSLRRLRGAARRGPPPLASAVTAGDFLDSSSARAAARTAGTAGRAGVHPRAPAPGAAGELAWGAMGLRGLGHLGLGRAFNTF